MAIPTFTRPILAVLPPATVFVRRIGYVLGGSAVVGVLTMVVYTWSVRSRARRAEIQSASP
jgi:hypothetical protein